LRQSEAKNGQQNFKNLKNNNKLFDLSKTDNKLIGKVFIEGITSGWDILQEKYIHFVLEMLMEILK
jgi:hypothetical protein